MSRVPIAVLISGSGTNLQALIDACADPSFPATIALVVSNRRHAYGLERARRAGLPTAWLWHKPFDSREAYDAAMVELLRAHGVQWICMAGFMRVVTSVLIDAFPGRMLNIHPALLPAFPGLDGPGQALQAGVKIAGCTVHIVEIGVDAGPIVIQAAVPVLPTDDRDALATRILAQEHRIFPQALEWATTGRLHLEAGRVRIALRADESASLLAPVTDTVAG